MSEPTHGNLGDTITLARLALEAQEFLSQMQKERVMPVANDPRYTPFIGEWNGYHAPEQRYEDFVLRRRELRRQALEALESIPGDAKGGA